eukprot:6887922-Pyramimonas_sp.AAC.1
MPWTLVSVRLMGTCLGWSTLVLYQGPFCALWASLKRVGIAAISAAPWIWPDGVVISPSDLLPRH